MTFSLSRDLSSNCFLHFGIPNSPCMFLATPPRPRIHNNTANPMVRGMQAPSTASCLVSLGYLWASSRYGRAVVEITIRFSRKNIRGETHDEITSLQRHGSVHAWLSWGPANHRRRS